MKRSSILLMILGAIIIAWFVVFQVLCARAVVDISNGLTSVSAFRYEYKAPSRSTVKLPGITLNRFNELEIIGKMKVSVTIIRGDTRALVLNSPQFKSVKWWYDKERLVLSLEGKDSNKSSEAKIVLPSLDRLSCYYLEDLYIDGLDQTGLDILTSDVHNFILRDNTIKSLDLKSRGGRREKSLTLDKSNILDSLFLTVAGKGAIDIGLTGLTYGHATVSDSITLTGESGLLKKIIRP